MDQQEKAAQLFMAGRSCSQAVFGAFAQDLGMDEDTAMKLASFGGAPAGRDGSGRNSQS